MKAKGEQLTGLDALQKVCRFIWGLVRVPLGKSPFPRLRGTRFSLNIYIKYIHPILSYVAIANIYSIYIYICCILLYIHIPGWCPSKTWSVLVHEDSLLKLVEFWRSLMEEASLKKPPIFVFFALLNSYKLQLMQNTNNINHIKQPHSIPSPYLSALLGAVSGDSHQLVKNKLTWLWKNNHGWRCISY